MTWYNRNEVTLFYLMT